MNLSSIDYQPVLQELEKTFSEEISENGPTNLLCLKATDSFLRADVRVMIFGQETNDWEIDFLHPGGLPHLLETYNSFFNNERCFSYGGQFWNGFAKLRDAIRQMYSEQQKTVGFIWNNVIKIGRCGGKGAPSQLILDWQKNTHELIRQEIAHYSPDVVIFLSGPNYDKHIMSIFDDVIFSPVSDRSERQLAKLTSDLLPLKTLRTYHPNYLWRNDFYSYLDDVVAFIKS